MDAAMMNAPGEQPRLKVSTITRLIAAAAFTIPLVGGALGSVLLMGMFRALGNNQNAGIGVVMAAMKEASLPVIVSLYLAAVFGFVVIVVLVVRMFVQTKKASPPFWFFILGGIVAFVPAVLFWRAQLLILDVLSPGSSAGAAGISGVASEINMFVWASIVAAPIVFLILIAISVVPLPSRPGPKVLSLIAAAGVTLILVAAAVGIPFLIDGPNRKNEIVSLPANVKTSYSDHDGNIEKESSMVLTLSADNKLYERQSRDVNGRVERTETVITNQELTEKVKRSMEGKTPDRRIVYFKCDVNATHESVLQVFQAIRNADVDRVGLVVIGEKTPDDPYQTAPVSFQVRLQEQTDHSIVIRPNPLMLVAALDKDGKLTLNNDPKGTIADASRMETTLKNIFKERENSGIFREGTNEVEKLVYIKASKSAKYGDFIKLVEAIKTSGAQPIGIQIDDIN